LKFGINLILITLSKTSKQVGILVLSVILARYLTKDDYGTYLHVQLIANVAIWSFVLGIPHSVYYFLPKTGHKRRFVLVTATIITTIATLVASGIWLISDHLVNLLNNPALESLIYISAGIAFFQIPVTIFESMLISTGKVKLFVAFDSIFNIGFFFVILIPTILTGDIEIILKWLCAFYGLQMIGVLGILLKIAFEFHNDHEGEPYSLKGQFGYAVPIGISEAIFELARYGDKIIISNTFNPATLAVYARGAMDIPLLTIVNNTIDNLMMPELIEAYKDNCAKKMVALWHDSVALTAAFMYPSFFFLWFAAPYLIPGLYGEAYKEAIIIFQIYSLGILFRVSTYNVIVRVIGKTGIMAYISACSETANIIGTIILVKMFGIWGAPAATVFSTGIIVFGYLFAISHRLDIKFRHIFPWKRLGAVMLAAAAPLIVLAPISYAETVGSINLGYWGTVGVMAFLYTGTYYIVMRSCPALNDDQKALLRLMLPPKFKFLV